MNNVTFYPHESCDISLINEYVSEPIKASSYIPSWFKNAPRFQNNEKEMFINEDGSYHNLTVRHCMPFLDAMTSGYFLTTWTDIHVKRNNGEVFISYENQDEVSRLGYGLVQYQKYFQSHVPTVKGYDPFLYAWSTYWRIKTDPGVSCLFTQPLNHTESPFLTLSGVIDTDNWSGSDVLNFAFKKDFEGTIPKGTPYVQIIPFKREEWNLEISKSIDHSASELRNTVSNSRLNKQSGYYRDNLWNKKGY